MKRCEQCGATLRKGDLFCPKCGHSRAQEQQAAPQSPVNEAESALKRDVIHVSENDVVLIEPQDASFAAEGGQGYTVKTAEQLAEEERAYQEDREPVPVGAAAEDEPAPECKTAREEKVRKKWGGYRQVSEQDAAERIQSEERSKAPLGVVAAVAAVLLIFAAAAAGWAYISTDSFMLSFADRAVKAENYEAAIATLEKLMVKDGANPEVYYRLCLAYRTTGQDGKALAAAQLGYDSTKDERLSKLVTELTFGGETAPEVQQPAQDGGIELPPIEQAPAQPNRPAAEVPKVTPLKAELLISPMYEFADGFVNGLARVKQDGKWGFIDKSNKFVIPAQYDETLYFTEDLAAVKLSGKWGYIDRTGAMLITPQYDGTLGFFEGFAACLLKGKWGFIDKNGGMLQQYDGAESFSLGLAAVKTGGAYGFVNTAGEMVIPAVYQQVLPFSEGVAPVMQNGKWGYVDSVGRTVIEPFLEEAYGFQNGVARVKSGGKYGYINRMGWQVTPCIYDQAWGFSEGLATVKVGDLYGYINLNGDTVIEPTLEDVWSFSQGLVPYKQGGVWGYLNAKGEIVIQPQFIEADRFFGGVAKVKSPTGSYGYINLAGEYICLPEYDDGGILADGMIAVKKNGKWGYIAVTQS